MAKTETAPAKAAEVTEKKPRQPRLSAVERLTQQLEAARLKDAERAGGRIEKATTELEAATKDYTRAKNRKDAAELALSQLKAAAGSSGSNGHLRQEGEVGPTV